MTTIQAGSIVVGVDGSEHSDRAVRWAAEQAHLERRPLVAVSAAEAATVRTVGWTGSIAGSRSAVARQVLAGVRRIADDAARIAREARPEIEAVAVPLLGDPRQVLVDLSSSAHVLVLGSRGRGSVRSLLLGSVSAAVSRSAACPLVVCRPVVERSTDGVVVGADGTPESLPVIEFAFRQASLRNQPLTVLHCFWDVVAAAAGFREAAGEVLSEPHLEEERLLLAESVAGFQEKYPDVRVSLLLRHGLVDEALTRRGSAWDLVVVGRQPLSAFERIIPGAIATAVVERAHAPVAVVPEAPSGE